MVCGCCPYAIRFKRRHKKKYKYPGIPETVGHGVETTLATLGPIPGVPGGAGGSEGNNTNSSNNANILVPGGHLGIISGKDGKFIQFLNLNMVEAHTGGVSSGS